MSRSIRLIEVNGVVKSVREWAQEIGVTPRRVRQRLADGWSPERAVTEPLGTSATPRGHTPKLIECNGVAKSARDWARDIGSSDPHLIRKRLAAGWSVERAVTVPVGAAIGRGANNGAGLIEFNGKVQSLAAHARDAGLRLSAVQRRIDYKGWTVERALTEPIQPRRKGRPPGLPPKKIPGTITFGRLRRMAGYRPRPMDGRCDCCRRPVGADKLVPDHCHEREEHRGWLCRKCNTGIGMLGDQPDAPGIRNALAYLQREIWDMTPIG